MHVLDRFAADDLVELSRRVRDLAADAPTMVDVAQRVTDELYGALRDEHGEPALASARVYKTHRVRTIPDDLLSLLTPEERADLDPGGACLVRLAATDGPAIQAVVDGDDIIQPLTARGIRERPLMGQLLDGLGVDVESVLHPDRAAESKLHTRDLDLFYVPHLGAVDDLDSEARSNVADLGIQTMVCVGGVLMSGELFITVLFANLHLDDRVAQLLRSLGLAVKAALIPTTFRVWPK